MKQWLTKLIDSSWTGRGELWLDTQGNNAIRYDCELHVVTNAIYYTWFYENEKRTGCFTINKNGAIWIDSWHQPKSMLCLNVPDTLGLFTVKNSYDVPSSPSWGWQSKLSERPDGKLVLQMTNITPWGEDGRAVRMVFTRNDA
ncbi:MAG: hypothetical protein V7782_07470 [Psychromonas sp.]